jgi:hypothetical protein
MNKNGTNYRNAPHPTILFSAFGHGYLEKDNPFHFESTNNLNIKCCMYVLVPPMISLRTNNRLKF